MKISLTAMYLAQTKLDARIHEQHHLNYVSTRNKRILALLVELGELANETRCFKYWSYKGMSEKKIVLDEYADGLHFFLSLGIDLNCQIDDLEVPDYLGDLSAAFIDVYATVIKLQQEYNASNYYDAFQTYLAILKVLNYSFDDLCEAYFAKLQVNYERQKQKY